MLTFASSLPCLHTFWHAIPTSSYIFNVFYFLVYIGSCSVCRYVCMVNVPYRTLSIASPFPVLSSNCLSHTLHFYSLPSRSLLQLPVAQLAGAIYCDRALRINGFTGEGVQSGTVLIVKAHSVTPRWITTKTIDFDSKVTLLISLLL